ncbi:MAG TPA: nucleotide exchange factor GrpE [Actinobacteria bacterium]|nr:nucleotide exchange factor GrpE [Actinomycetota bacterium]
MSEKKDESMEKGKPKETCKSKKLEQKDEKGILKKECASLKERLKEKEKEAADYLNMLKRLQAEFENYKKRIIRDQAIFLERASEDIIAKILPVLDNLERALNSTEENTDFESFKKGVEMVHSQLVDVLKKAGSNILNPIGEGFNPHEHEAFMQVESDEHEEGKIVEVLQKGYLFKGKILRPAIVKIAKGCESKDKDTE